MRLKVTVVAVGMILSMALMLWQPPVAAYQPGCFGTPTPTTDPDSGGGWIQPACPTITNTPKPTNTLPPTRTQTPTPGNTPSIGGGDDSYQPGDSDEELIPPGIRDYNPDPGVYNYPIPVFPKLASPTAYATGTPDGTQQAVGSFIQDVSDFAVTLEALNYTPTPWLMADGSPVDLPTQMDTLRTDFIDFFGYIKGLNPEQFGKIGRLITFALVAFVIMAFVWSLYWIVRLFFYVIGFLISVLKFIFEFARTLKFW